MSSDAAVNQYPRTISLPDGQGVQMRLMTAADRDAMLAFARSLPQEDLLFLRIDITDPAVVDEWIHNIEAGLATTLLAFDANGIVGYATVHRNRAPWTRRVGELRVNVGPRYRTRGLGRSLTSQIFDLARGLGLRKLMANMTTDQHGAQAAFRRLGFVPEALLADYVEDRNGTSRDLVMMSYDIGGHTDHVAEPLRIS
jgi:L-amino acid N-acyltransferase YncA